MKKIVLTIMAIGILASCSNDDGPSGTGGNGGTTATLLKKTIETAPDGTQLVSTYTYEGNRITAINHNNGTIENYAYQGNFLTEIRHYKDGGLIRKETFLYDSNGTFGAHIDYNYNLANPANNNAVRTDYSYDGNKVNFVQYTGDESRQENQSQTGTLTLVSNGNIIKFEGSTGNKTVSYSYDFKNSPLKEVYAYGILALTEFEGGVNNVTSTLVSVNGTSGNTLTTYTYNDRDYPATAVHTTTDSSIYNIQYFY
ncbi:hypothetical protein HYN59_08135 [Flavobacterium album]|uniref:DUF4595 domain-containing protein n=1 Tax=Flavobacterium album TaxID=2175091 RepID=A0A2S1QXG6_9FLAO|nr:hypothetical protein [Flavobacterium album]AWH85096.1 hypothetical protein HYN59_08135 [Flavobacterium album]